MKRFYFIFLLSFLLCNNHWESKKNQMIQTLIQYGIKDERVLKVMQKINRHEFVPESYKPFAYEDTPLPIGFEQTISQPFIVAYMPELLEIKPEDIVLEIGTGSGYQSAVLAELVKQVVTIEIEPHLCESSRKLLKKLNYKNVLVICGDGYKGYPPLAPYDKIIITAAPPQIPQALLDQLNVGGIIVAPIGKDSESQYLYKFIKLKERLQAQKILPVRFVPMIEKNDFCLDLILSLNIINTMYICLCVALSKKDIENYLQEKDNLNESYCLEYIQNETKAGTLCKTCVDYKNVLKKMFG